MALDLESEAEVVVAAFFIVFVVGGLVGCQFAEVLGGGDQMVDPCSAGVRRLDFVVEGHIARVGILGNGDAVPVAGNRIPVAAGSTLRLAVQVESGRGRVVIDRRQDDWIIGGADHLDRATDAIFHIDRRTVGGEAGIAAGELDHEAFGGPALQPQSAQRVLVEDSNFVAEDMDDVGVVPDGFSGKHHVARARTDIHAVVLGSAAGDGVVDGVQANERAVVVAELVEGIDQAGGPTPVGINVSREGIGVDGDGIALVVDDLVAHDHRLGSADEDGGGGIRAEPVAIASAGASAGIQFDDAVGDANVGLMYFDRIEIIVNAVKRDLAAAIRKLNIVETAVTGVGKDQAAPVAAVRLCGLVVPRIEPAAHAVRVVVKRSEHDRITWQTFRDELTGDFRVDSGIPKLDDYRRINSQPGIFTGHIIDGSAGSAADQQVGLNNMDDVGIIPTGCHFEDLLGLTEIGGDPHGESVDRVVEDSVAVDVGT